MGQEFSKQSLFVIGLKESLKTRGARVKKRELITFLDFVGDICPCFPQEGRIDEKRWCRVGDRFKDYYEAFGPTKIPITAFSYWSLTNDILRTSPEWPDFQHSVSEKERSLRTLPLPLALLYL